MPIGYLRTTWTACRCCLSDTEGKMHLMFNGFA